MLLLHQGKEKSVSNLSDGFRDKQAFPYLLSKGKFGYNASEVIPIGLARYFNQKLLNFNQ